MPRIAATVAAVVLLICPWTVGAKPSSGKPSSKTPSQSKASKAQKPKVVAPRTHSAYIPCFDFANVKNRASYTREISGCRVGGTWVSIELAAHLDPPETAGKVRLKQVRCFGRITHDGVEGMLKASIWDFSDPDDSAESERLAYGIKHFGKGVGTLVLTPSTSANLRPADRHYVLSLKWRGGSGSKRGTFRGCRVDWAIFE